MLRLAAVVLQLIVAPALGAETLTFTTPHDDPISTVNSDGFIDRVVTEAVRRTGNQLKIIHLPAERALINANRGIDDGALHRVAGLSKVYPNLVQASESTFTMSFVAFSNDPKVQIKDWSSLEKYSVGIITGWKILEKNIPPKTAVTKVRNPELLFSLLEHRRVNVILYGKWQGLYYLKTHNLSGVNLLSPPLAKENMYVYFNKKYQYLIPPFSKALREMKKDGSRRKIYRETLQPLIR